MPNFTFCWGHEHKAMTLFSFPELQYSVLEFNSRKNCQHYFEWIKWDGMSAIKFEAVGLFCSSDVLIAVAVVVA